MKENRIPVCGHDANGKQGCIGYLVVPAGTPMKSWNLEKVSEVKDPKGFCDTVIVRISPPETEWHGVGTAMIGDPEPGGKFRK